MSTELITPVGRILYPAKLDIPQQINGKGEPKFQLTVAFPPNSDFQEWGAAMEAAVADQWPGGAPPNVDYALSQARMVDAQKFPDMAGWYLVNFRANANNRLQNLGGNPLEVLQTEDPQGPGYTLSLNEYFYPGSWVRVHTRVYGWNKLTNNGVGCNLNGSIFVSDGERLASGESTSVLAAAQAAGIEGGVPQAVPQAVPQPMAPPAPQMAPPAPQMAPAGPAPGMGPVPAPAGPVAPVAQPQATPGGFPAPAGPVTPLPAATPQATPPGPAAAVPGQTPVSTPWQR